MRSRTTIVTPDLVGHATIAEVVPLQRSVLVTFYHDQVFQTERECPEVAILLRLSKFLTVLSQIAYTRTDAAVADVYLLKLGNIENELEGAAVAVSWVLDEWGIRHNWAPYQIWHRFFYAPVKTIPIVDHIRRVN
jgi:hypothetical protein